MMRGVVTPPGAMAEVPSLVGWLWWGSLSMSIGSILTLPRSQRHGFVALLNRVTAERVLAWSELLVHNRRPKVQ